MNSFLRRSIAAVVLVSFALLASGCASWHARNTRDGRSDPAPVETDWTRAPASTFGEMVERDTEAKDAESYMSCHARGSEDGNAMDASGSLLGGFCGGLLLGAIGAVIALIAQSEPEPPAITIMKLETDECRYVYCEAYGSAGKAKKQENAVLGGLMGTAVGVVVFLAMTN